MITPKIRELFPNHASLVIFILYMVFCVGQGIFVTASRKGGENYDYNIVTVVLFTESTKLILACLCYIKDNTISSLFINIRQNIRVLCLYLVPSFLYCIYNNLAFINLSHFDPTTYFILLQLRVVITGIVFQVIFNKSLSRTQWFSLVFLTFGCMMQQLNFNYLNVIFNGENNSGDLVSTTVNLVLILIQTLCSCLAGVYNEYLLKEEGAKVNIFIQNVFMYLDSILWNVIVLTSQGKTLEIFTSESITPILKPLVIVIIVNNSLIGITTSLFLKNLNSILKTFASALEIILTALLSWMLFGIEVKVNTIVAIAIVSYSIYLYSQNPIDNRPKRPESEDGKRLLEEI